QQDLSVGFGHLVPPALCPVIPVIIRKLSGGSAFGSEDDHRSGLTETVPNDCGDFSVAVESRGKGDQSAASIAGCSASSGRPASRPEATKAGCRLPTSRLAGGIRSSSVWGTCRRD